MVNISQTHHLRQFIMIMYASYFYRKGYKDGRQVYRGQSEGRKRRAPLRGWTDNFPCGNRYRFGDAGASEWLPRRSR